MEFSVPAPVVEPIVDPSLEPKEPFKNVDSSSGPNSPVNINNGDEAKTEANLQASEATENSNEVTGIQLETVEDDPKSNLHSVQHSGVLQGYSNGSNENAGTSGDNHVPRNNCKIDNEKTFNILIRGRRNRKQTLRMPISLLNRPYNSQSFKVIYSRVIRGGEAPKSTSFPSDENGTASAT